MVASKDANLLKLSQFIASQQRLRPQQTLKSCCKQCLSYSTQWILLGHVLYFGKRICPRIGGIKIFARLKTDCLHFYFKNGLRLVGGPANSDYSYVPNKRRSVWVFIKRRTVDNYMCGK